MQSLGFFNLFENVCRLTDQACGTRGMITLTVRCLHPVLMEATLGRSMLGHLFSLMRTQRRRFE